MGKKGKGKGKKIVVEEEEEIEDEMFEIDVDKESSMDDEESVDEDDIEDDKEIVMKKNHKKRLLRKVKVESDSESEDEDEDQTAEIEGDEYDEELEIGVQHLRAVERRRGGFLHYNLTYLTSENILRKDTFPLEEAARLPGFEKAFKAFLEEMKTDETDLAGIMDANEPQPKKKDTTKKASKKASKSPAKSPAKTSPKKKNKKPTTSKDVKDKQNKESKSDRKRSRDKTPRRSSSKSKKSRKTPTDPVKLSVDDDDDDDEEDELHLTNQQEFKLVGIIAELKPDPEDSKGWGKVAEALGIGKELGDKLFEKYNRFGWYSAFYIIL